MKRAQRRLLRLRCRGTWGGRRPGAGRKATGVCARASHKTRPELARRHPVHLTMKVRRELGSLRKRRCLRALEDAFWSGRNRFGFRLNHFSVRHREIHVIAEAAGKRSLSRGAQGLEVRMARRLNKVVGRKGTVFVDRYRARIIKTSREMAAAIEFVLQKYSKQARGVRARFGAWCSTVIGPLVNPRTWILCSVPP